MANEREPHSADASNRPPAFAAGPVDANPGDVADRLADDMQRGWLHREGVVWSVHAGTDAGETALGGPDTTSRAVPHTAEGAKTEQLSSSPAEDGPSTLLGADNHSAGPLDFQEVSGLGVDPASIIDSDFGVDDPDLV